MGTGQRLSGHRRRPAGVPARLRRAERRAGHDRGPADRFEETGLTARRVELGDDEDEFEATFERGWSDGLPVVPPTEKRVLRMLAGTSRDPAEVVGLGAAKPRYTDG